VAGALRAALKVGERAWTEGSTKESCVQKAGNIIEATKRKIQDQNLGVDLKLDYIDMNDSQTFEVVDARSSRHTHPEPMIMSGALWVGRTRLIDNIILGKTDEILS